MYVCLCECVSSGNNRKFDFKLLFLWLVLHKKFQVMIKPHRIVILLIHIPILRSCSCSLLL